MAHYIPKDALTEWIEKELREEYTCDNSEQEIGYHSALYRLQDFIDKTEAKDIADDLEEREAVEYIRADRLTHNANPEKARQRALERCPKSDDPVTEMRNERKRYVFIEGYTQGQQDLAMTWRDVGTIHSILNTIFREMAQGQHNEWTPQDIYTEALRRFNEARNT